MNKSTTERIVDAHEDIIFSVKDIQPIIEHLLTSEETCRTPILLIGESGIGKTAITRQIAKKNNWDYIDVRFSGHLPEDIKIPTVETWSDKYYKNELGYIDTSNPGISIQLMNLIKRAFVHNGSTGLLDLEEINRATPETMNVLFQLIGDRALDEHTMNPNWRIIGSINPDTDSKFTVNVLDFAFKRRWLVFKLRPDLKSFMAWGQENNIHPAVLQFLKENPDALYKEITDDINLMPAIWERTSNILYSFEHIQNNKIGSDILKAALGASVGISLWNIFYNIKSKQKEYTVIDMIGNYADDLKQQIYVKSLSDAGHISELTTIGTGWASSVKEVDQHLLKFCHDVPIDVAQCILTIVKDLELADSDVVREEYSKLVNKMIYNKNNEADSLQEVN